MRVLGLPFSMVVDGDLTSGGAAELTVELKAPWEEQKFDQLRCAVAWFAKLGHYGGLGGDTLSPTQGVASLGNAGEPVSSGTHSRWIFDAFCVDPRTMVVLGNLVYSTGLDVVSVSMRTHGTTSRTDYTTGDFPNRFRTTSFTVDEDRTTRDVEITVEFASDVPPAEQENFKDALRVWCLVCALGGFRLPGLPLGRPLLVPEDDPDFILDQLVFTVRDNGVHPAGYDALVNVCAAHSLRNTRITLIAMH